MSQDIEPDFALVSIFGFDRFEDVRGNKLERNILKKIQIPAQLASDEEAMNIYTASGLGEGSAKAIFVSNFIVNLLLLTSLNQLWGAINNL